MALPHEEHPIELPSAINTKTQLQTTEPVDLLTGEEDDNDLRLLLFGQLTLKKNLIMKMLKPWGTSPKDIK